MKTKKSFVVGIFDSGLGGLTVVKEIKKKNPNIDVVYLGDTARVPYGTRSFQTIRKFAEEDTKFLIKKKVNLIIVACNTVSSLALDVVKKYSNVPVLGVIKPAIKKASKISRSKKIGLVGTRATVESPAYQLVSMRRHASMLVPLIEEGIIKGPELNLFLKKYFTDFINHVDTLILGCTHYPLIKNQIDTFFKKKIKLVDPAEEVAKEVFKMTKDFHGTKKSMYFLTDVNHRFLETAKMFLGKDISKFVKKVEI